MKDKGCTFHEYSPAAFLRVGGEDARSFLQGQFTNDVPQKTGALVYGLWLTQKGKVLADSYILNMGGAEFAVISVTSSGAVIQTRLEQYIIADDVTLSDETGNFTGLAVWGDDASDRVRSLLGDLPPNGGWVATEGVIVFSGRRVSSPCFELLGPREKIAVFVESLRKGGAWEVDAAAAERMRIQAGVPAVPIDIGPGDLPNEGGLDQVAISYTKGCYLGQEVMARLKSMGQVRRRLQMVRGAGALPTVSTPLYQGGVKVGEIRSAAVEGDGFFAWAMLSLVVFNPSLGLQLAPDGPVSVQPC